jgi:hypothetical protein
MAPASPAPLPNAAVHSTAHYFLEALNEIDIEYLFCNFGTDHAPLIEELARFNANGLKAPKIVLCPHENVAIHMAGGYAQMTGKGQAVLVHVDAGTANAALGMHNLFRNRVPVLLIAGSAPFTSFGELEGSRDTYVHFIQQPFDQGSLIRPYVKWEYTLPSGITSKEILRRAHTIMQSEPAGPVYLMLPREVLTQPWDEQSVRSFPADRYGAHVPSGAVNDLAGTSVQEVAIDLSAGAVGDGQRDTVTVNATNGKDRIDIASDGTSVVVDGLSARVTIDGAESANDSLIVNGLGGDDTIDASGLDAGQINLVINGGTGTDVLTGSAGDDLLNGGSGNDTMNGGDGNDTFVWNPGDGSDVLRGEAGTDTLLFNGADVNEAVVLSADGGRAVFSRDVATVTMNMDDVETIDFNAFGGADTVTINDLSGTDVKQVNVDLAASPGGTTGDAQDDTIIINGTAGDDAISLSIENGALVISGLASKITIEHFDANDTIRIAGLGGDDVIDASGIGADGPKLIFDGGDDNDILIGGGGNDTILGGAGDDVLVGGPGLDVLDGGPGNNVVIQDLVNQSDFLL